MKPDASFLKQVIYSNEFAFQMNEEVNKPEGGIQVPGDPQGQREFGRKVRS